MVLREVKNLTSASSAEPRFSVLRRCSGQVFDFRFSGFVFLLLMLCFSTVCGEIIFVGDYWPADFNNIQAAIDNSWHGDIVIVLPGIYTGQGNRDITFGGRAITVRSVWPEEPFIVAATVIDCNGIGRGFEFNSGEGPDSVLEGVSIVDGNAVEGGGIWCNSRPTIRNCRLVNNTATLGGGLYCGRGDVRIIDCRFEGNTAIEDGGGLYCYNAWRILI